MPTGLNYQGQRAGSPQRHKIYAFDAGGAHGDSWISETAPNGDALTRSGDTFDRALKKEKKITFAMPVTTRVPTYTKGDDIKDFTIEVWDPTLKPSPTTPWRQIVLRPAKVLDVKEVEVPKPTATIPGKYKQVVLSFGNAPVYL
jgi:hypothetical protein